MRKNLETDQVTIIHNKGERIYDIAILNEKVLFVERYFKGIKSVPKDASGPVASQEVDTTGLDGCFQFHSIHVVEEGKYLLCRRDQVSRIKKTRRLYSPSAFVAAVKTM